MPFPDICLRLPDWLNAEYGGREVVCASDEERMALVIAFALRNVNEETGGPFGAAVFERSTGLLIAPGVNVVTVAACSAAHAEMMAVMTAQQVIGTFDLGGPDSPDCELVTSCEPCAMCFGAIPWSGVRRVTCGATEADARAAGFDEGPKPADWTTALTERGIAVRRSVLPEEARHPFIRYQEKGGLIYNARQG